MGPDVPSKSRKGCTSDLIRATLAAVCSAGLEHAPEVGRVTDQGRLNRRPGRSPCARPAGSAAARRVGRSCRSAMRAPSGRNRNRAVIGPAASASRSAASSVVCATAPRHCSSSRISPRSLLPFSCGPARRRGMPRARLACPTRVPDGEPPTPGRHTPGGVAVDPPEFGVS